MSNHILLVGAPGVGKDYIVQHVTGNTEPITWISTTDSTTSPTNNTYSWNIQNKYYSATLSWHIVTATDTTSTSTLPPLTESNVESLCPPEQHESVQALVLVYDPTRIQTWEAVESWHHYISRYNPSILLVVANHITSTSTSTPIPSAALAWCSEYGCEHIIMPHGNTLTTSTTKSLSASEQDHDMGCTRIVDAMHANMWNIMTRKEVTMNHGMDDVDEGEEQEEEDLKDVDVERDEKTHDTLDDIPDLIPKAIADEEKQKSDADTIKKNKNARKNQRKREKKKEKLAATATTATVPPSTSTSTVTTTSSSTSTSSLPDPTAFDNMTESDLERSLESFSAMFDRVRGIREQASSGTMSDEMRRKQAANAIMSMLQGLGIEDEADDDSENEIEPSRQPFGPEPPPKITSDK